MPPPMLCCGTLRKKSWRCTRCQFPHSSSLISSGAKPPLYERSWPSALQSWRAPRTRVGPSPMMWSCFRAASSYQRHLATRRRCWNKLTTRDMKGCRKHCSGSGLPSTRCRTINWLTSLSRVVQSANDSRLSIFIRLDCYNRSSCHVQFGQTLRWISWKDFRAWGTNR
jgi:hypothetical protein